jgi:drug/metabolite transporter (DMT)-like permease
MATSTVIGAEHARSTRRRGPSMAVLLAFFAIYFLWGSTYLSIRTLVATVPPLLAAGLRFSIAGAVLFLWTRLRREALPTRQQWRNLAVLGALMFLAAYGGLFWAEQTVPSGVASLLVAMIPVCTAIFEIFVFRREKLTVTLAVSVVLGVAGVATLVLDGGTSRGLPLLPCLAILGSEICWSLGSVLSKEMDLPASKTLSAGCQMLSGGLMLLIISAFAGNLYPFPAFSPGALGALAYLIVAGSLLAFTAYVWLLARMPVSTVASYAYVNPVVALAIGFWLGNEAVGARTLIGAALVLASVILILLRRQPAHS